MRYRGPGGEVHQGRWPKSVVPLERCERLPRRQRARADRSRHGMSPDNGMGRPRRTGPRRAPPTVEGLPAGRSLQPQRPHPSVRIDTRPWRGGDIRRAAGDECEPFGNGSAVFSRPGGRPLADRDAIPKSEWRRFRRRSTPFAMRPSRRSRPADDACDVEGRPPPTRG